MTSYADALERVQTWTEAEFLSLPEDGPRIELVDGALVVSPMASRSHQRVVSYVNRELERAAPPHLEVLSDINVRVGPMRLLRPDIVVLEEPGGDQAILDAAHLTLAGEVTSPSNSGIDRLLKPQLYAAAGVPFYLRIDLAESVGGPPRRRALQAPRGSLPGERGRRAGRGPEPARPVPRRPRPRRGGQSELPADWCTGRVAPRGDTTSVTLMSDETVSRS